MISLAKVSRKRRESCRRWTTASDLVLLRHVRDKTRQDTNLAMIFVEVIAAVAGVSVGTGIEDEVHVGAGRDEGLSTYPSEATRKAEEEEKLR